MFECFSEPNGGYSIMAIDESKEAYIHVVRVLLDAVIDSPIDLLLRADNCTSIDRLRHLINQPGLLERAEQHGLNTDQYDDLRAIESYINWAHNEGHSDITTRKRGSFDHFFDHVYDVNNPTIADKEEDNTSCNARMHETTTVYQGEDDVYLVSQVERRCNFKSLVDRGANGGIAGDDMRLISHDAFGRTIDVQGINNHEIPKLKLGTCGAVVRTQRGYVILIFHQYAHHGRGKSIHSCIQLEDNSVQVDDHPSALGGTQSLVTVEGYAVPLDVVNGLLYFNCRPFTDDEWNTLPHVIMTRDVPWSPRQYDSKLSEVEDWYKQLDDPLPNPDNTENVTIASVIGTTATDTQRSLSQDYNEDSRLIPFTKENKLLYKGDDTDLSPTVYFDVDDSYGPSQNNLDLEPQEPSTPYPAAVNTTILGCQEPVTTALSTYIRAWGEWSFAQIYIESMLVSDRVSKHVKDAIRSFVIKDWQWIDNKVKKYDSRNLNCWSLWEQYLKDHGEKPFQKYIKEDHGEKQHQLYMSTLDMGYHPELEIVGCIEKFEGQLEHAAQRVKFRVKVGDGKFEDIAMYDEMCDLIIEEQVQNEDGACRFRKIPISAIYKGDKYRLAVYAIDHDLLDEWESPRLKLKQAAMNNKTLLLMINQAKLQSHHTDPAYMYGLEVHHNHEQVMELDQMNGVLINDLGHKSNAHPPDGYEGTWSVGDYQDMGRSGEDRTHTHVTGRILLGIILFLRAFTFGFIFGKNGLGNGATSSYVGELDTRTHPTLCASNQTTCTRGELNPRLTDIGRLAQLCWIATLVDPGISLKVKDSYIRKYKPMIAPILKSTINDHPMKVYDPPEALCYLIDRGANGGKYVEDSKANMYGQSRKDAEETYTDKRSTFWGDIRLRLEKATLAHLDTVKLALGTEEKALMREMEDSDGIVLERRLEIIRNKKGINAREIGYHALSDEGSGLTYTQSNGRGVTNGYAFG
jgi:hypothetical protein